MTATTRTMAPRPGEDKAAIAPKRLNDLHAVVDDVVNSWRQGSERASALVGELRELSTYIQRARADVAAHSIGDLQLTYIPSATDQLDAIVEMTEAATNRIMSAAERCETIVAAGGDAGDMRERIGEAVTEIYEACAFQDITGQRVRKVVEALHQIEAKLDALLWAFDVEPVSDGASGRASGSVAAGSGTSSLEGPQRPGQGTSQAEIDAMFDRDT